MTMLAGCSALPYLDTDALSVPQGAVENHAAADVDVNLPRTGAPSVTEDLSSTPARAGLIRTAISIDSDEAAHPQPPEAAHQHAGLPAADMPAMPHPPMHSPAAADVMPAAVSDAETVPVASIESAHAGIPPHEAQVTAASVTPVASVASVANQLITDSDVTPTPAVAPLSAPTREEAVAVSTEPAHAQAVHTAPVESHVDAIVVEATRADAAPSVPMQSVVEANPVTEAVNMVAVAAPAMPVPVPAPMPVPMPAPIPEAPAALANAACGASCGMPPPQARPQPTEYWDIREDNHSLRDLLQAWSKRAGWQLSWELPTDFYLRTSASIPGDFETAIETVVMSMQGPDKPFKVIFYEGNRVMRIVGKGEK